MNIPVFSGDIGCKGGFETRPYVAIPMNMPGAETQNMMQIEGICVICG